MSELKQELALPPTPAGTAVCISGNVAERRPPDETGLTLTDGQCVLLDYWKGTPCEMRL